MRSDAQALPQLSRLTTLRLSLVCQLEGSLNLLRSSCLSYAHADQLLRAVGGCAGLRELDVSSTEVFGALPAACAAPLAQLASLTNLSISGTAASAQTLSMLVSGIAQLPALQRLDAEGLQVFPRPESRVRCTVRLSNAQLALLAGLAELNV